MDDTHEEWLAKLDEQMKKRERVAQLCAQMGPKELESVLVCAEALKISMIIESEKGA